MPYSELIPAVAYGDAAGLPFETKHADYIAEAKGYTTHLIVASDNPFYKGETQVGSTSDDTELTCAVAEAIITKNAFDIDAIAESHVAAYNKTLGTTETDKHKPRGWGGSTTSSVRRIIEGVDPALSGEKDGAGNGVLMKMSPLSVFHGQHGVEYNDRVADYDALTTMTHDSDVARACTTVHGEVLNSFVREPGMGMDGLQAKIIDIVSAANIAELAVVRRAASHPVANFAQLVERHARPKKTGFGYGFFAPETLAICYDVFFAAKGEFNDAVWLAANLGGDADSTASIVAAMCTLYKANEISKPDDFELVANQAYNRALSTSLGQVSVNGCSLW